MGVPHIIAAVAGIFAVTLIFTPFYPVIGDYLVPALWNNTTSEGQSAMANMVRMFYLAPIVLIIGLVVYMFATAQRREYDSTQRPYF